MLAPSIGLHIPRVIYTSVVILGNHAAEIDLLPCRPVTYARPRYPDSQGSSPYVSWNTDNGVKLRQWVHFFSQSHLIPTPSWISQNIDDWTPTAEPSVEAIVTVCCIVVVLYILVKVFPNVVVIFWFSYLGSDFITNCSGKCIQQLIIECSCLNVEMTNMSITYSMPLFLADQTNGLREGSSRPSIHIPTDALSPPLVWIYAQLWYGWGRTCITASHMFASQCIHLKHMI